MNANMRDYLWLQLNTVGVYYCREDQAKEDAESFDGVMAIPYQYCWAVIRIGSKSWERYVSQCS